MDITVIISLIVLAAITAVEFGCLFLCSRIRGKIRPIAAVVPIFPDTAELPEILDYYGGLLSRDSPAIDRLFFIDYGAGNDLLESCRDFCRTFDSALLLVPEELEKNLSETFAFSQKI